METNPRKWSNTLKQFVGKLPTICFSGFDHFVGLTLKGLRLFRKIVLVPLVVLLSLVTVKESKNSDFELPLLWENWKLL